MTPDASRSPSREELNEFVVQCLAQLDRDGPEGLDAFCSDHPEAAEVVRRRVRHLESTGMLELEEPALPQTLGEFRLLEVLGRGGMGVVHRAEQASLRRIVALKVLRTDHSLSPARERARFQREIDAATRLSHPNIVQVHAAGSEQGVPFFAMELVEGASLATLLRALEGRAPATLHGRDLRAALERELREPARGWNEPFFDRDWEPLVLDLLHQVAQAVVHAHERGVWHRDLKPSNVMLTPGGLVKVVDFGLASLRGASRMTVSGSPLGSLPYMAPELFEGRSAGLTPAADVYSLGVVMYELLTLKLPHWDETPERLIRRIVQAAPLPLRQVNPSVARDVAVVCERALAPELVVRHPDPRALLADLESLRRGEAVSSRPAGPWRAARRIVRRHPAASSAVVLLSALLVTSGLFLRERLRAGVDDEQRVSARTAAHRSVRDLLDVSRTDLSDLPGPGALARLRSVDAAAEMWRVYYEQSPQDPPTRLTWARLRLTRANTLRDLGRAKDAVLEFDAALAIFREESARAADDATLKLDLAAALHGRAAQSQRIDRAREALALAEEAVPLFRELHEAEPQDEQRAHHLATAEAFLAQMQGQAGDRAAAAAAIAACAAEARAFRERWPQSPRILAAAARALVTQANLALAAGDPAAAEPLAREALGWFGTTPLSAASGDLRDLHARLLEACANACRSSGRLEESDRQVDRAVAETEELITAFPHWPAQRRNLAILLDLRARSAFEAGDFPAGWQAADRAIELLDRLAGELPDDTLNHVLLALVRTNRAHSLLASDPAAAAEQAQQLLDRYLAQLPEDPASKLWGVGVTCAVTLARGRTALDELAEAKEALLQWEESLPRADPWHHRLFADAWNEWILGVRSSPSLDDERRRELEQLGAQRMFDRLAAAIARGYRDAAELLQTPSLASFRGDPRFQELIGRIGR